MNQPPDREMGAKVSTAGISSVVAPVPPGYKLTKVGVIPEDWNVRPLAQLAEIRTGIAKNSNVKVSNPLSVYYLRVANVQDGFLDISDLKTLEVSRSDIKRYEVLPGDVLMNEGGDLDKLGRGSIWRSERTPCVHQNHVFVVRCSSRLSPNYLNAWTGGICARRYFMVAGKQTTNLATINKTALGRLPVVLPAKAEQEAIAVVLSDADALIEALEQLIAKKRQLKQGTMHELLTGKRRLPGFSGEWGGKRLGDVANFFSGGTPSTAITSYYGGDIPWITSSDLNKSLIWEVAGRITQEGLENSSAKMIEENTLLIALYGATSGVTAISKIKAAINQAVLAIVPRAINNDFLFYKLSYLKDWVIGTYTQGGQPNLSGEIVKSIELTLPNFEEQTAIAQILTDMDAEIAELETKLAKARAVKQGMMQQLLTGKIRLVKPEQTQPPTNPERSDYTA